MESISTLELSSFQISEKPIHIYQKLLRKKRKMKFRTPNAFLRIAQKTSIKMYSKIDHLLLI